MKLGVYVIHFDDDPTVYKIGCSTNIDKRIGQVKLEQGKQAKPIVDLIIPANNSVEARLIERGLHTLYSHKQAQHGNEHEWFYLTTADLNRIRATHKTAEYTPIQRRKRYQKSIDLAQIWVEQAISWRTDLRRAAQLNGVS